MDLGEDFVRSRRGLVVLFLATRFSDLSDEGRLSQVASAVYRSMADEENSHANGGHRSLRHALLCTSFLTFFRQLETTSAWSKDDFKKITKDQASVKCMKSFKMEGWSHWAIWLLAWSKCLQTLRLVRMQRMTKIVRMLRLVLLGQKILGDDGIAADQKWTKKLPTRPGS